MPSENFGQIPQELRYAVLRAATELFGKPPVALAPDEFVRAEQQARREFALEKRILESPEAGRVVIPGVAIERAFAEIVERYENEDAYAADLAANGLDEAQIRAALERQARVESVLELVGSRAPEVSEIDVAIYYHSHRDRFDVPERREVHHILISINPDFPENSREQAAQRLEDIAARLKLKPREFEKLAGRHSECPTALQGGRLGLVPRGELYPELDAVLFALKAGQISGVVESPMGFHLLWCKAIQPAQSLSLQKATPAIRKHLKERQQRICQRAWIATLPRTPGGQP
jgi:peptidyl-prolyl cis-trans isomerase C